MPYSKRLPPIECDQEYFNEFSRTIGLLDQFEFRDAHPVLDPELRITSAFPIDALILVFHCSARYKDKIGPRKFIRDMEERPQGNAEVVWFKQEIGGASAFYAILHAICNQAMRRRSLSANSTIEKFINDYKVLRRADYAKLLERSDALQTAFRDTALQGAPEIDSIAEEEFAYRYVCFVRSLRDGHLYELDGELEGPIDHGCVGPHENLVSQSVFEFLQTYRRKRIRDDIDFSLFSLAQTAAFGDEETAAFSDEDVWIASRVDE